MCFLLFLFQVLRLIILHVQSPDEQTWKGVLYASVLLVSSLVQSLTFQHSIHQLTIVGMQVLETKIRNVQVGLMRMSI